MKVNFTVPQKWDDLSEWQINKVGHILFHKKIEGSQLLKFAMVFILFIDRPSIIKIVKFFYLLSVVPFQDLLQYTDFMYDKKHRMTSFRQNYKVRVGMLKWQILAGPASRLSNITILELSYADTFFYNWITEGNDIDLHRLCAVLYRPTSSTIGTNDKRVPFDRLLLEENSYLTDKIPLHQKFMIALAFQGSRDRFAERFPNVFPQSKEKVKTTVNKRYTPFSSVINAMAMDEIQPFGTLNQTENSNANQFLEIYNETLIRQKEEEKRLKKLKRK